MGNFGEDIQFGEIGEIDLMYQLNKMRNTKLVLDVRDNPKDQKNDIDFVQITDKNDRVSYEVKTDRKAGQTGNMVYEIKSNSNEGCLERCRADWLYYYLDNTEFGKPNEALFVAVKELRELVKNGSYLPCKMGDNATGYLIPLRDVYGLKYTFKSEISPYIGRR